MITKFNTVYIDSLPLRNDMKENTIYVSKKTWQSSHLCACGCGEEVLTPNIVGGWSYFVDEDDNLTMRPGIHNDICKSSYEIRKGYAIL